MIFWKTNLLNVVFQVCEQHFKPEDIRKTTTAYDEKTGQTLSYDLTVPQLVPGAVPTLLPNCSFYLSSSATSSRASRNSRNMLREKKQLATALAESKREHERMVKDNLCYTMDDLRKKIKLPVSWHATFKNGVQYIYKIEPFSENKAPTMDPVVFIDEELRVNVFVKSV